VGEWEGVVRAVGASELEPVLVEVVVEVVGVLVEVLVVEVVKVVEVVVLLVVAVAVVVEDGSEDEITGGVRGGLPKAAIGFGEESAGMMLLLVLFKGAERGGTALATGRSKRFNSKMSQVIGSTCERNMSGS